ncbi:MAG TPA: 5-(carboxyamino)imidazole ribonucleotide synthase [Gammaproteobacteria bacterium]|nr:5-(carboxyamino)imidazole ribonucleotide synthase [Gammaproteobacteria bacterium]
MNKPIFPGATLGVLGSGQLGRMFAIAARRMGYRVNVLSPDSDTPTGQIADVEVRAAYEDLDAIARFAQGVAVVTFEFENVPSATAETAVRYAPVRPAGQVLHTTQNRRREKTWLRDQGIPLTPFEPVQTSAELSVALQKLGVPAVLKTAAFGYDGKGQAVIFKSTEADTAWQSLKNQECILESHIDFEHECSIIAARGLDGKMVFYGPMINTHGNHILDTSVTPGNLSPTVVKEAFEIARAVMEGLEVVGVLCVEFFLDRAGKLLVNELAPRPHNSGHLTIDGHVTSQFEQQVRSVCGLPLGSSALLRPAAAMANILGDLWGRGEPRWDRLCAVPEAKLHLYGKSEARPGRKMGHINAVAGTTEEALRIVTSARSALTV